MCWMEVLKKIFEKVLVLKLVCNFALELRVIMYATLLTNELSDQEGECKIVAKMKSSVKMRNKE